MEQPREQESEKFDQQKEPMTIHFQEAVALLSAEKLRAYIAAMDQIEVVPIRREDGTVFYSFRKRERVFVH